MSKMPVNCREMTPEDLDAVWELLGQLGYDMTAAELLHRFDAVSAADGHLLLVAGQNGRIDGFLHVFARPALEKLPEAIVQSMAVEQTARRVGIGRALMTSAEEWARTRDLSSIALYSEVERVDAHAFYARLGYEQIATSGLLRKQL